MRKGSKTGMGEAMMEKRRRKQIFRTGGRIRLWAIVAAFVAAGAVYLVLLQAEKEILKGEEQQLVVCADKRIPKGELLSIDNYGKYIRQISVGKSLVPDRAILDPEELFETAAMIEINAGTILTEGMMCSEDEITADMDEPVIAGFQADELYQVAGGVLRPGDRIHLYRADKESGDCHMTWENLYVWEVFDTGGNRIESDDGETAAQKINVFLDKKDVARFYSDLGKGGLRVVKAR